MDQMRWERMQALFHAAADLPEAARQSFLEATCGADPALAAEVLALLREDARSGSLLDRGLADAASSVFDGAGAVPLPTEGFGPYRISRVLGEGGMGVVYLADREDLGSVAAIKLLRDAWLSPTRRERFISEQRVLAQLNHPSIARLYDANTLPDGTPWFVMEYVEGVPLTEYCRGRNSTIPERLALFRAVCVAVQHAHQHAVIHRDLKPSNILVKPDGSVKLLDFGIAKQLESLDRPDDQTRTGLRLMTPAYAAPEQIRAGRVGIHTDVYALGVILYELLAGRLPFDLKHLTPGEAETLIAEHDPERPSAAARGVLEIPGGPSRYQSAGKLAWADLDVLCLTAMHKDPERRYRTVEALLRDIDHYLQGEPLEASPDSLGYRFRKFVRRHRRPVSAAAVALAVLIGMAVFYTLRLAAARNAALAQAARAERIQRFTLNLFQGGDEAAGPADSLRVVALLDRGVQEARSLDGEPAIQADLYQTLGGIYQQLGNLDRADSLLRAALAEREQAFGRNHLEVARSLVALGLLRADQAEYDEAERLIREGLTVVGSQRRPDQQTLAKATAALGRVLEERGEYQQAIPVQEEAVRLLSAPGNELTDLADGLNGLANTHFYAGHYAISDSLNRRVLAMSRRLYGERHPHVADDLINLGAIQYEWGRYREAEQYQRQALEIVEGWYGQDHPETASVLTQLARALNKQNRVAEAKDLLRRALAVQERVYGPVHPRVASALNELGVVALAEGRPDEAEAAYRRMAAIYRQVYGEQHYLYGVALSNLANVFGARKQYREAERLLLQAIACYVSALGPDHSYTLIGRIKLGRVLLKEGRYADAEPELLVGHDGLVKQPNPPASWLTNARGDLATVYDSLRQEEKAAKFRAELADTVRNASAAAH